jgi:type I restriction enzyme, S subunit
MAQVGRPLAFNQDIKALIPDYNKVDPDYLYWFLRGVERIALACGVKKGATVHSVQSGFIENLQVPVATREEQRRIVDILSRAKGIVRLRREAQKKAAEIIPALFLDMFGHPATNSKGWPTAAVGDVIIAADYGSSTKASDNGTGVPLIRMGNVDFGGYLNLENLKYVELPSEDIERFGLLEGDILFNRTNSKDLVGKTGMWDGSRAAVAASYFIRVRVASDRINPFFFWAFMNSAHMKRVLFDTARGAIGQSNINARELRAFQIMVPSLNLQNDYEQRCRDVFSIQSQQALAIEKAQATFDALLAKTFNESCGGAYGTE